MSANQPYDVVFPLTDGGERSTSALGRSVVADALRDVDPSRAGDVARETTWRSGYLEHFRWLTVAGLSSRGAALSIARDGLDALHHRMRVQLPDGSEADLETLRSAPPVRSRGTVAVAGTAAPERELTLPYRGRRLRGDDLRRQLRTWVAAGIVEPSCEAAVGEVVDHPEWLALPGRTVVVLGAGAEVGPLFSLLRWGCTVAGVDLPQPAIWERILRTARNGAGTLLVPVAPEALGDLSGDEAIAAHAGVDIISEVPAAAEWIGNLEGAPVLGSYIYADGGIHVRASVAVDALTLRLQAARDDLALAFLATPTDVFAVPADAVEHSIAAYRQRSTVGKVVGRPLRTVSGGRLLQRAYAPGADPGICDALVPQQGPNYALAKRVQRWRAAVARDAGTTVSLNVAPSTRTRSVTKNRVFAAAFAGAHRFGVEVFDPATTNTLMAALLVHDLSGGGPTQSHPWQDEAHAAAHGGLWRMPYAPRSALGLATVIGLGSRRA